MDIDVGKVVFREDLYPRKHSDQATAARYAEQLEDMPPIEVNQDVVLIDGWHRWTGHKLKKRKTVPCIVTETASDAEVLELAIERNRKHGLPLSREDEDEARSRLRAARVERVAEAREDGKSLRAIAEEEGVSVTQVRDDLDAATVQGCTVEPKDGKVKGKDGKVRPAKAKKEASPKHVAVAEEVAAVEPAAAVDGFGIPIQAHAAEAFKTVAEFGNLVAELRSIGRRLSALCDETGGLFLQRRCVWNQGRKQEDGTHAGKWVHAGLQSLTKDLEDCKPTYTVCPYAHNPHKKHDRDCPTCRGLNWTPALNLKSIPADVIEAAKEANGRV